MSDLKNYINSRKKYDPEFARDFDTGYEVFKLGVILRQFRENAGLTQKDLAGQLHVQPAQISQIENHSGQVRLEVIESYAAVLGKQVKVLVG